MASIKEITDTWFIKKKLKPYYLPILLKIKQLFLSRQLKKKGVYILDQANDAFNELGIFYWVEFGTLLGIIRDGKLIGHDTDIDVGIFLEDYSDNIEITLNKYGFKKTRRFEIEEGQYGIEESYTLNNVNFDIFYFTKNTDGMYCHLFPKDKDKKFYIKELRTNVNTFRKIEWNGIEINVLSDSDQRLMDTYGNYKVKDKKWYTPDDALNAKIVEKNFKIINY